MSELGISARKHGAAVRAFFGVPLVPSLVEPVTALADALRGRPDGEAIRWVRPEGYHLTLQFLGNVDAERVPELADAVVDEVARFPAFAVKLGAPEAFPSVRRPQVVVLGCSPEDPLVELAAAIGRVSERFGHKPEKRPFLAHLTLGRLRSQRLPSLDASAPGEWLIDRVVFYRSDLEHTGAVYTALETIPLAGATAAAPDAHPGFNIERG